MADTNETRSTSQESEDTREEIERACQNFLQLLHPDTFRRIEILVNLGAETRLSVEKANHSSTKLELAKEKKDRQTLELKLQEVQRQLQLEGEAHADTEATRAKLAGQLQQEVMAHANTEAVRAKLAGQLQQEMVAHANTEVVRAELHRRLQSEKEVHRATDAVKAKLGELKQEKEAHRQTEAARAKLYIGLQEANNQYKEAKEERVRLENELKEAKAVKGQVDDEVENKKTSHQATGNADVTSNQTTNDSSTTLNSSDSGITTSETIEDGLSELSGDPLDNFEEIDEVADDLAGLSETALLALEENAHLDQDLIHPLRHEEQLRKLFSTVCKGSVAAISEFASEMTNTTRPMDNNPNRPGIIPQPLAQSSLDISHGSRLSSSEQTIECSNFVTRILANIEVMQKHGCCTNSISYLRPDFVRSNVAVLTTIGLDRIQKLASIRHELGSPENYLKQLDKICHNLFGQDWISKTPRDPTLFSCTALRVLDLIILSYTGAHVGAIDHVLAGRTVDLHFKISGNNTLLEEHMSPGIGSIVIARRKFRCLDGFFGKRSLWVFHSEVLDLDNSEPMYLSATPDAFGDIWGPMWQITNTARPEEILRFDLENGAVVPSHIEADVTVNANEELCHWMSNSDFIQWNHKQDSVQPYLMSKPWLLIGASDYSLHKNQEECFCDASQVTEDFRKAGYLHESGTLKPRRQIDSIAVGTGFGGAGIGAPSLNITITTKITAGRTLKEQTWKRWMNGTPCNWYILLRYFGVEISFCTDNSRRRRLIDLLASITMRNLMEAIYPFSDERCRREVRDILRSNPFNLLEIPKTRPQWREGIERAIGTCLSVLYDTGTTPGVKDPLRAFWVFENQEYMVQFPREAHEWTGLVLDYDESCAFVILEEDCLVRKHGRGCQHTQKDGKSAQTTRQSSVFETALIPNDRKDLPEDMILSKKLPPHGKCFWDVSKLRGSKYKFRIGEHGKLTISKPCGNRALMGRWEALPLLESGKRKLVSILSKEESPKFHFERLCDSASAQIVPIKFFVLS